MPSLVRAYEKLSAAGMRVLSPSGLDFVADRGFVLNQDEPGTPPESIEWLPLNCIRAADLVWLHAPEGYVGLSGALEIGFANAAGVPIYAEEMPSDIALRSLVTISPLDQVIAETSAGEKDNPGASLLPLQEHYSAFARERVDGHKSAHDIMLLITEEIGELARRESRATPATLSYLETCAASSRQGLQIRLQRRVAGSQRRSWRTARSGVLRPKQKARLSPSSHPMSVGTHGELHPLALGGRRLPCRP